MNNSQEWTTVTYIKPPKPTRQNFRNSGVVGYKGGNYHNSSLGSQEGSRVRSQEGSKKDNLNSSSDSDLQQATSTSFDKGSQYIPFGDMRGGLRESGDSIPFSSKEHRFVSKKDRNSANKTDSETETVHQRLVSKDLAKRITQYRKNNSVTQQQLSDQLGIPLDMVQNYERGTAVSNKAYNSKFHNLLHQQK